MLSVRRVIALVTLVTVHATSTVIGTAVLATAAGAAPSSIDWERCGGGLQCASLDVPVDYSQPDGEQVALALARRPADSRADRIGSLVVNWGGPGNPGTETLRLFADSFPAEIQRRFDIVTFDPRGTGSSRPIDCVDDATFERLIAEDPTPDSPSDLRPFYDGTNGSVDFIKLCIDKFGSWLSGVGTRNVAQDVDRIRAAMGESRVSFLGYSYGTVIGAVYAQMFPDHVRAMVLDSAVNLSDTPESALVGNLEGFEKALDAFLADCESETSCEFHSGGEPRAELQQLRDRFEDGLTLDTSDGRTAGTATFYLALLGALYDRGSGWDLLASALGDAVDDDDGSLLALIADSQTGRREDGTYDNIREAIGFITCSDRRDPVPPFDEYERAFTTYSSEYPFFGRFVASYPLGCDPRLPPPAPGSTLDDVRTTAAPPVLVIGTTDDPATPYAGARDLRRRLGGSRLLTFVSTEHGSYTKGIRCIDDAVDRYLLRGTLPRRGTRCAP